MKKFFSIIAVSVMTLSLSSFQNTNNEEVIDPCYLEAIEIGNFMDGYNGRSAGYYSFQYIRTFCDSESFTNY